MSDTAKGIIMMVLDDLTSRKGFDAFWDDVRDDIKDDITAELEKIAQNYVEEVEDRVKELEDTLRSARDDLSRRLTPDEETMALSDIDKVLNNG